MAQFLQCLEEKSLSNRIPVERRRRKASALSHGVYTTQSTWTGRTVGHLERVTAMSTFRRFHLGSCTLFLSLLIATLIAPTVAHAAAAEPSPEEPAFLAQIQAKAVQRVDRHWLAIPFLGIDLGLDTTSIKQLPTKVRSFAQIGWDPLLAPFTRVSTTFLQGKKQSAAVLTAEKSTASISPSLKLDSKWSITPQLRMPETVEVDRLSSLKNPLRTEDLENRQAEDDQILLDVQLAYQASDDLDISLCVENLSNEEVLEIVANPAQRRETGGRYVGLGFNYRF